MKNVLFVGLALVGMLIAPEIVFAEGLAPEALRTVGKPIITLLVVAAFGWVASYLCDALGYGNIGGMIKVITIFSCIGVTITTVVTEIGKAAEKFGLSLW